MRQGVSLILVRTMPSSGRHALPVTWNRPRLVAFMIAGGAIASVGDALSPWHDQHPGGVRHKRREDA